MKIERRLAIKTLLVTTGYALLRPTVLSSTVTACAVSSRKPPMFPRGGEAYGPLLDVREFGAHGDGTSDDSVAVNRLIAGAGDRATVFFPSGEYRLGGTLFYRTGIRFLGAQGSTLIQSTPTLFDQASRGFTGDVSFENLTITARQLVPDDYTNRSGTGTGRTIALKLYAQSPVNGVHITNCRFTDIAGRAVFIKGASEVVVVGNTFVNVYDAIELGSSGDRASYRRSGVKRLRIRDNVFRNVSTGVVLQGLSNTTIDHYEPAGTVAEVEVRGNHFIRTSSIGVQCYAFNEGAIVRSNTFADSPNSSIGAKLSRDIIIADNSAPQILVQGAEDSRFAFRLERIHIERNRVIGEASRYPKVGIMVWRQADRVRIVDNDVSAHRVGIAIGLALNEVQRYPGERQSHIQVLGNRCHHNEQYGIHTLSADRVTFRRNKCYDNGTMLCSGIGHQVDGLLTRSDIGPTTEASCVGNQRADLVVAPGALDAATQQSLKRGSR